MKKLFLCVLVVSLFVSCKKETATESGTAPTVAAETDAPLAFADAKYTAMGKESLAALSKGDMDTWMANYADNAKYYWNSGDSLVGKPAIDAYWRDRRNNLIETITFTNDIWIPLQVNKLENVNTNGIWLLGWYKTTAKYKGGKTMSQYIHTDFHFNQDGKIDEVHQYVDRASINAALPPMK